jgi:hypothetical protein
MVALYLQDVGEWLGAASNSLFNFHPSARPAPLELRLYGFDVGHFGSRLLAMAKPTYTAITTPLGKLLAMHYDKHLHTVTRLRNC